MTVRIDWVTIDSPDPAKLAPFWTEALGYRVAEDEDDDGAREILLAPPEGEDGPRLLLLEVHDEKVVKNRLHLDLRPDDRDAEVERLIGLGATRVDIGQGDVTWVVLADPDGNEFCVLRALP